MSATSRGRSPFHALVAPAAAAFVLACGSGGRADSLHTIPLPAGGSSGAAVAISANGGAVAGTYINAGNNLAGFYWPGTGAAVDLGFLGGPMSSTIPTAISADGTVVVGTSASQAFRWTAGGGLVGLPFLPGGFSSVAFGVNGDGSIVVGQATSTAFSINGGEAFRWTQDTGTVRLGTLDTNFNFAAWSRANAISANGQVIVGQSTSDLHPAAGEAFRWTQPAGMVGLGTLTGTAPDSYSMATAVSADGSVIVGQSSSNAVVNPIFGSSGEAFRWTQATGMVGLGALNPTDFESGALGVSADGGVVVGYSIDDSFQWHAFRWTQASGMRSIASLLTAGGVNVAGWIFERANGVSADGTVIVGSGVDGNGDSQAWIARFPVAPGPDNGSPGNGNGSPGNGSSGNGSSGNGSPDIGSPSNGSPGGSTPAVITLSGVARSFAGLAPLGQGAVGRLDAQLSTQMQIAANHACGVCAFAYGVGGTVPGDPFGGGALGVKADVARDTAVGIGLGAQAGRTGLVHDGSVETRGGIGSLFVAHLPRQGLQLLAALTGETIEADVARGYFNGNTPTRSTGSTKGHGIGGLVRAGWTVQPAPALHVTPFVSYGVSHVRLDGWTEADGPFPARFEAIRQTTATLRLGGDARYAVAPGAWLWGGVNWVRRFGDTTPEISGTLIGLFPMTVPGLSLGRDAVETTAGARLPLGPKGAISASATMLASANEPATFLGRVAVSRAF